MARAATPRTETAAVLHTGSDVVGSAAATSVGQAARQTRKSAVRGADEQSVGDAKSAAGGQKAREVRKAGSEAGGVGQKAKLGLAKANPLLQLGAGVAAASTAYTAARESGASHVQAAGAGAVAGAPNAAFAAAPTLIGRLAPVAAGVLSKAAVPLMVGSAALGAAKRGYDSYQRGDSAAQIAGNAALGAADSLTFGAASAIKDKIAGGKDAKSARPVPNTPLQGGDRTTLEIAQSAGHTAQAGSKPSAAPMQSPVDWSGKARVAQSSVAAAGAQRGQGAARIPVGKIAAFNSAAERYAARPGVQQAQAAEGQDKPSGGPKGWANPIVQQAAQRARGVENVSDWAADAKPMEK